MPEYPVVIGMAGIGENLAAQLIAEIGDIIRYERKQSLSGYDAKVHLVPCYINLA